MAGRPLKPNEASVWLEIRRKIAAIVKAATRARLEETRALGGAASQEDWYTFGVRFRLLDMRLQELEDAGLVQVNEELDFNMGANTATSRPGAPPSAELELSVGLVDPGSTEPISDRAMTVIHELSHSLIQANAFPVLDYCYRDSWAPGYLGAGEVDNADNYREAAAQIAEDLDGLPMAYREAGRAPTQRETLRAHGSVVGAALAWADIKANRCWLRSGEYVAMAEFRIGMFNWEARLKSWQADPDMAAQLEIEKGLRKFDIVGRRILVAVSIIGLSGWSTTSVQNIKRYTVLLKNALSRLVVSLGSSANKISYHHDSRLLVIPRSVLNTSGYALGEQILDAVVEKIDFENTKDWNIKALRAHKREIVDLMAQHLRPDAVPVVHAIQAGFKVFLPPVPTDAQWTASSVDVEFAIVDGTVVALTRTVLLASRATRAAAIENLKGLLDLVRPGIQLCLGAGGRLLQTTSSSNSSSNSSSTSPSNSSSTSPSATDQRRRRAYTSLHVQLTLLRDVITKHFPEQQDDFDDVLDSVTRFM